MWSATPTPTATITMGVIEHCRVSPPPHTVAQTSLPLTFFDILWLKLPPFSRLLFYDLKLTTTNFTQQHLPNLKKSLSMALQHYFPLAGHLITPTTYCNNNTTSTTKPIIRYLDGDSVELTVAEYSSDNNNNIGQEFIRLTGNQSRDSDQLSVLAPQLAPPIKEAVSLSDHGEYCEVNVSPVLSVQVTIFPNQGICLGLTTSHAVADGSSVYNFIRDWGLISKHMTSSDSTISPRLFNLPSHDRSAIQDPNDLAGIYTSQMGKNFYASQTRRPPPPPPGPGLKKVRATFMLCQTDIEALKKLVSTKLPRLPHLSSFTVASGYLWSCLAKTRNVIDSNNIQDLQDEDELLTFAVNCQARLDPPLRETYFGNCITTCFIRAKNSQLVAEGEGFVRAAELIGESIHKKLHEGGGIMKDAETWYEKVKEIMTVWKVERITGIVGSPKFYFYDIDFGWGKPRKYEFVSERLSSSGGKDARGDMEFGVCLPENEMEVFSTIFKESLQIIHS